MNINQLPDKDQILREWLPRLINKYSKTTNSMSEEIKTFSMIPTDGTAVLL